MLHVLKPVSLAFIHETSDSLTCKQMTGFTRQPNDVERAWLDRPRGEKRALKELMREVLGLSSLTTTHVRMHDRSMPRDFKMFVLLPSC